MWRQAVVHASSAVREQSVDHLARFVLRDSRKMRLKRRDHTLTFSPAEPVTRDAGSHALVERGPLGGLQIGGAEEVGDLPGMLRVTAGSGAGALSSVALPSGRRSATAVRMAPRLTPWSRERAAIDRPPGTRCARHRSSRPPRRGGVRPCCPWPRRRAGPRRSVVRSAPWTSRWTAARRCAGGGR